MNLDDLLKSEKKMMKKDDLDDLLESIREEGFPN